MKNVYYALFYSHIVYAIEVWGLACEVYLKKIITLQKRVVRLMAYKDQFPFLPDPLFPSLPLFFELGLLNVKDVFLLQLSKFIHKCLNSNIICNFDNWFKLNCEVHKHQTRSNYNHYNQNYTNNLFIPFGRTTNYGLKLIKVSGPKLWNNVPLDIRIIKSLSNFKITLKNYILDTYNNF